MAPSPPPDSWAARPDAEVAIYLMTLAQGTTVTLPAATHDETQRALYAFEGDEFSIAKEAFDDKVGLVVRAQTECVIENHGEAPLRLLMLQGRPIGEPVAQHGPFVMNSAGEIRQAMLDFQRTRFGGWPWDEAAPVHPRDQGRFAVHIDGRRETPGNK